MRYSCRQKIFFKSAAACRQLFFWQLSSFSAASSVFDDAVYTRNPPFWGEEELKYAVLFFSKYKLGHKLQAKKIVCPHQASFFSFSHFKIQSKSLVIDCYFHYITVQRWNWKALSGHFVGLCQTADTRFQNILNFGHRPRSHHIVHPMYQK